MTPSADALLGVEKLSASDVVADFDCGAPPLNEFLRRYALVNAAAGSAQTYVVRSSGARVVGYYSLAVGAVEPQSAPDRIRKGLPRHPVPIMLLARLAVDRRDQGRGVGRALLKDALVRTAAAADIAGIRAVLVHAKDEAARRWYLGFEFEPSPTDPMHLFLLMKDLRAALARKE
ncbi:MAG: GNAT family N-acetyltransferase [Rhodospirillaceae bacterium]|nr:GNAT family N-acetyltransferase [Rhodospirillaceae bacterium]